ncbi:hypothetical protein SmJEL517_g06292 [Synchytrium microbalum]|uniref:RNA-directed DNA polymerase n=1 Tax=Synchytrium microbalum TaxID=1806994 RepID=A0A507BXE9_9FUNG|nr:uncharacterized protein SmJEL517_g06292 [Synchytrium microbalum]TPX30025.1 hypothetical protein SmJEL517_g06292 [Synchytrium microbalum]
MTENDQNDGFLNNQNDDASSVGDAEGPGDIQNRIRQPPNDAPNDWQTAFARMADSIAMMSNSVQDLVDTFADSRVNTHENQPAATSSTAKSSLRPNELPSFNGKDNKGETRLWVFRVRQVIATTDLARLPEPQQILRACNHLEGPAGMWYMQLCQEHGNPDMTTHPKLASWTEFEEYLVLKFGNPDSEQKAQMDLRYLKQKDNQSVEKFNEYYRNLRIQANEKTPADESKLIVHYLESLNKEMYRAMTMMATPKTLDEAQREALRIHRRMKAADKEANRTTQANAAGYQQNNKPRNSGSSSTGPMRPMKRSDSKEHLEANQYAGKAVTSETRDVYRKLGLCNGCGHHGHRKAECRNSKTKQAAAAQVTDTQNDMTMVSDHSERRVVVMRANTRPSNLLRARGTLNGSKVTILFDTGCSDVLVSSSLIERQPHLIRHRRPLATSVMCVGYDGNTAKLEYELVDVTLRCDEWTESLSATIAPLQLYDMIIGMTWFNTHNPNIDWQTSQIVLNTPYGLFKILANLDTNDSTSTYAATLRELQTHNIDLLSQKQLLTLMKDPKERTFILRFKNDVAPTHKNAQIATFAANATSNHMDVDFDECSIAREQLKSEYTNRLFKDDELPAGVPSRTIQHPIDLESNDTPHRPPYRLSLPEQDELKKQLDYLLERGLIRPSNSPFGAPVLFASKKDGGLRMCLDYRALNKITIKNRYSLPRIEDQLDRLVGSTIFTKVDLRWGYWQIPIRPGDEHKTAITTRYGSYEFLVMPFGLCNAPSTFQRLMNETLRQFLDVCVVVYLDDILIYSKSLEEHKKHTRLVFDALVQAKLTAKFSKCELFVRETIFLGFKISPVGIEPDTRHIKQILEWPVPQNVSELRSFLGLAQWLRRFILHYSKIVSPLTDLLQTTVEFNWTASQQNAFDTLKERLTTAPLLKLFDPSLPIELWTDSSGFAIGATLYQKHAKGLHPVAYEGRKMLPAERRYPVHEQELLALIHALKVWRHYLLGLPVTIQTDHRSLVFLDTQKTLSNRQARWLELLQQFDLRIQHVSGKNNVVSDALSRNPDFMERRAVDVARNTIDLPLSLSVNTIIAVSEFEKQVQIEYTKDPYYSRVLLALTTAEVPVDLVQPLKSLKLDNGLLWNTSPQRDEPRLCIPVTLRKRLLHDWHDSPLAGHRIQHTYKLVEHYYWPKMHDDIKKYIRSCILCQQNRTSNSKPAGLIQPLAIPVTNWTDLSMDFITNLPPTKESYDAIWVICCRRSKMSRFIPCTGPPDSETLARLFFDNIVCLFGHPASIVSDRDARFTSDFWRTIHEIYGTKILLSTANHPQTDGQTERTNRTLKQYLRNYTSFLQDDWNQWLSRAEYNFNSTKNASTGLSPFEIVYVDKPSDPRTSNITPTNDSALSFAEKSTYIRQLVSDRLMEAQERYALYANQHRTDDEFDVNDQVLISTQVYQPPALRSQPSNALKARFTGPYRITHRVGRVAYRIALPYESQRQPHDVFHVSQLRRYNDSEDESSFNEGRTTTYLPQNPPTTEPNMTRWQIEKVLGWKKGPGAGGPKVYVIKWTSKRSHENVSYKDARLQDSSIQELLDAAPQLTSNTRTRRK